MMNHWLIPLIVTVISFSAVSASAKETRTEFEFSEPDSVRAWQIVNDGVMGGRSSSRVEFTDGYMRFRGNLSLENNGGFASVRLRPRNMTFKSGENIVLRVKGDGRTYTFNLYTPDRRVAFSYQQKFKTKAGEWVVVKLPMERFVAHWFGRPRNSERLAPSQVNSIGILLGDKKSGSFELLVDWIGVE